MEKIKQLYGLKLHTNLHPEVKQLKKWYCPNVHGHRVWKSGSVLIKYLSKLALPSTIMELGCGWGIASIYCAKHGSSVIGVDSDPHVFPFLDHQASINGVYIHKWLIQFSEIEAFQGIDWIIGADICFWPILEKQLYTLIERAFKQNVERIILADPGRPPFNKLCKRITKKYNTQLLIQKNRLLVLDIKR